MKDKRIIKNLINNCENIITYMKDIKSLKEFSLNQEKIDSILFNFIQIGENSNRLSDELKNKYENLKSKELIGLRNMISHNYEGITIERIYVYAKKNIPILKKTLKDVLKNYETKRG